MKHKKDRLNFRYKTLAKKVKGILSYVPILYLGIEFFRDTDCRKIETLQIYYLDEKEGFIVGK